MHHDLSLLGIIKRNRLVDQRPDIVLGRAGDNNDVPRPDRRQHGIGFDPEKGHRGLEQERQGKIAYRQKFGNNN